MTTLHSVKIPFCGFYESAASQMLDDELEQAFDYSDGGGYSHIPDEVHWMLDFSDAQQQLVKAYLEAWQDAFKEATGINLSGVYDGMDSPREYNFSTDRIFIKVSSEVVQALWAESVKDNHVTLAKQIKASFTSYDGFWSHYSNDLATWLEKPVLEYDHNELMTLLVSVLSIHSPGCEQDSWGDFGLYTLLEHWQCNGGASDAVWSAMPDKVQQFAELQRDFGKPMSWELWEATGKAYEEGTTIEDALAEGAEVFHPRCKDTIELNLGRA